MLERLLSRKKKEDNKQPEPQNEMVRVGRYYDLDDLRKIAAERKRMEERKTMGIVKCPVCEGRGVTPEYNLIVRCSRCCGSGAVFEEDPPLKVKLDQGAVLPTRAHEHDGGLDLYAMEDVHIWPSDFAKVDTGVHIAIPQGYVGLMKSRSSLMVGYGVTCDGTIDSGYTGAVKAILFNNSGVKVFLPKGCKVCQMVIVPCITPPLELVDSLEETERGDGGFGSTGK